MLKRFAIVIMAVIMVIAAALEVTAQTANTIMYQGRLVDTLGIPISNPDSMTFSIYADSLTATSLWSTKARVLPNSGGVFTVELGPFGASVFNGSKRYLGIKIGTAAEMTPRQVLTAAPYSLLSNSVADGAVTNAKLATNSVTSDKIADGSINLIDIGQNAAATGQVIKWSGTNWAPGTDNSGPWSVSGSSIYRYGSVGINTSAPADTFHVVGNVQFTKAGAEPGELTLRTPGLNDPGRYGIRFSNNTLGPFLGDDSVGTQTFGFYSKWSSVRTYDAEIQIHGKAANNWASFLRLTHDGTDGIIGTDLGDIVLSPAANVGIGTATPDAKLTVNGTASKPGGGSWAVFSDRRLKTDIKPFSDGLATLSRIKPVTYRYNGLNGLATDKEYVGVIAQDMLEVAPYTVSTFKAKLHATDPEETELYNFDANALWYISINAIKELALRTEKLEKLQAENRSLEARLTELEQTVQLLLAAKAEGGKTLGSLK